MNKKKIQTINKNLELADKIGNKLLDLSDLNFFNNSRRRDYVELRSLLVYLLYNKAKLPWVRIAEYFVSKGKKMDHANAMYLEKTYLEHKTRNPRLAELEESFEFAKNIYIHNDEPNNLTELYSDLKFRYDTLKTNCIGYAESKIKNDFFNEVLDNIPADRFNEVIEKLTQLKKSWEWKYPVKK